MTKKTVTERVIADAYNLAIGGALKMAQQDEFAKTYLDTEQGQKYLALCVVVRESKLSGQPLLDAIFKILE